MYRLLFAAILGGILVESPLAQTRPNFQATQVFESSTPVFALEKGAFRSQGNEVVCLVGPSDVYLLDVTEKTSQNIFSSTDSIGFMHNRPSLSTGQLGLGEYQSLVICGNNLVTELHWNNGAWHSKTIKAITGFIANLWGARVGDYDPDSPNEEIMVIEEYVFDFSLGILYRYQDGQWSHQDIYENEVGMDSAAGDFNPAHAGPEIVIPTEMGVAYQLVPPGTDNTEQPAGLWPSRPLWEEGDETNTPEDDSGWVVKIADVDSTHPGNEIVYGTRYNNRIVVSYLDEDGNHRMKTVLQGIRREHPRNMWDIATGDVLANRSGQEIVGVDESGTVYLAWKQNDAWRHEIIYETNSPAYACLVAEVASGNSGAEILVGGESGQVILLEQANASIDAWHEHHQSFAAQ